MDSLLTYRQAAQFLGCSEKTVWNMAHVYKSIQVVTVGKRLKKIPKQAINDYLKQSNGA